MNRQHVKIEVRKVECFSGMRYPPPKPGTIILDGKESGAAERVSITSFNNGARDRLEINEHDYGPAVSKVWMSIDFDDSGREFVSIEGTFWRKYLPRD